MKTKTCIKCGVKKSIHSFYRHSEMADGFINECIDCTKIRIKKSVRNIKKDCLICGKEFGTCISEIRRGSGKFCSRECWYKWNKAENTYNYKGENAGYEAKHIWVKDKLGSPSYCEHCKSTEQKTYQWSNISGKYRKDISDWQRLCAKCHKRYDMERMNEIIIKCMVCGIEVKTKSKKRKFCSKKCSNKYYKNKEHFVGPR